MKVTETADPHSNWREILYLWEKVCYWAYYRTPEDELRRQMKTLLIVLWNEKDWLKSEFPKRAPDIERFVNNSKYLSAVGDLANTLKHRKLDKKRSKAVEVEYRWTSMMFKGVKREMGMVQIGEREFVEFFALFRNAIVEYEQVREDLYGTRSDLPLEPAAAWRPLSQHYTQGSC